MSQEGAGAQAGLECVQGGLRSAANLVKEVSSCCQLPNSSGCV